MGLLAFRARKRFAIGFLHKMKFDKWDFLIRSCVCFADVPMVLNALKKLLVSAPASNNAQTQALQAGILVTLPPSGLAMVSEVVSAGICLGVSLSVSPQGL
jgi:hypothetical protein